MRGSSHSLVMKNKRRPKVVSIAELFHENTKQRRHQTCQELVELENLMPSFRRVPGAERIRLPEIDRSTDRSFEETVLCRRSVRDYSGLPVQLKDLAYILRYSYGMTGRMRLGRHRIPLLASPSAGALYPMDLYLVSFNVEGIKEGIYHYNVPQNSLELTRPGDHRGLLYQYVHRQNMIKKANAVAAITGDLKKIRPKYKERGYRYLLIEAGHICQNIYLTATALNLGAVSIGGFLDDQLNSLLGLDGLNDFVIYLVAVGKPKR